MNVIWSAASVRHLQQVVEYLQGESASGAISTRRRILETVWKIGQMPYSGRIGRVVDTREAVVSRSPYIVVYQVSAQAVEILGIWHGARDWPAAF
jgi:plasmid stabilization system protein ParE